MLLLSLCWGDRLEIFDIIPTYFQLVTIARECVNFLQWTSDSLFKDRRSSPIFAFWQILIWLFISFLQIILRIWSLFILVDYISVVDLIYCFKFLEIFIILHSFPTTVHFILPVSYLVFQKESTYIQVKMNSSFCLHLFWYSRHMHNLFTCKNVCALAHAHFSKTSYHSLLVVPFLFFS